MDLTPTGKLSSPTRTTDTQSTHHRQLRSDLSWAPPVMDNLLEDGETFQLTVNTKSFGLTDEDSFTIQIKPASGAVPAQLERTVTRQNRSVVEPEVAALPAGPVI